MNGKQVKAKNAWEIIAVNTWIKKLSSVDSSIRFFKETPFHILYKNVQKKRVCFVQELSAYHAVNTLNLGYTKPVC
jgi:hypothetical protein